MLGLKILAVICLGFVVACSSRSSTTNASFSDNKTYEKRKHTKSKPIAPLGNLYILPPEDDISTKHYQNIVNSGYSRLEQNEDYFIWLASERHKRLSAGKLNGAKKETVPGANVYYQRKTRSAKLTEGQIPLNEIRYVDIHRNIQKINSIVKEEETQYIPDIRDYEIIGAKPSKTKEGKVTFEDYE